jgi:D-amino-acid oxidase
MATRSAPSPTRSNVLVIGAGVVGLTTALVARRVGYRVVVVADRFAPDITSVIAGALWEWPPAVCGYHRDERSLERSKWWCMNSYVRFQRLAMDLRTGVQILPAVHYFRRPIEEDPIQYRKMLELRRNVPGFRRGACLAEEYGVNPNAGVRDAYTYLAPMIDTDTYMGWLLEQAEKGGCQIVQDRIEGDLAKNSEEILDRFDAHAIVNCTGLGSAELTGETVYPLRGALVYVKNDGQSMPRITSAHCMAFDDSIDGQNMVFIVPRGTDRLVLGGLVEPNEWSTDINLENYAPIRDMFARCQDFLPTLHNATPITEPAVRVGLRPARRDGVRLSIEEDAPIVHNVGHGGSGVTLSWGCAEDAVNLLAHMQAADVPLAS